MFYIKNKNKYSSYFWHIYGYYTRVSQIGVRMINYSRLFSSRGIFSVLPIECMQFAQYVCHSWETCWQLSSLDIVCRTVSVFWKAVCLKPKRCTTASIWNEETKKSRIARPGLYEGLPYTFDVLSNQISATMLSKRGRDALCRAVGSSIGQIDVALELDVFVRCVGPISQNRYS